MSVVELEYSSIMDRFRDRLVVPIFDATGKKVLGFGGRVLKDQGITSGRYKAPKYLNSPESKVFKKKTILFGYHAAKAAMEKSPFKTDGDATNNRAVVVVEGYMDAMALWQSGIHTATSCMGTGLTVEQLVAATRIAKLGNGKLPFCSLEASFRCISSNTRMMYALPKVALLCVLIMMKLESLPLSAYVAVECSLLSRKRV